MEQEHKGLLEDLILEMMEVNQNMVTVEKTMTMSNDYLNNINANSWASFEQLHIIANILSGNQLAALEKAKEDGILQQRMIDALKGIEENTKEKKKAKDLDMNITNFGSLLGLIQGYLIGYWKQIQSTIKALATLTQHVFKAIGRLGSYVFTTIKDAIKGSKWLAAFSDLFDTIKKSLHKKLVSNIVGLYMSATLWIDDLAKFASKNKYLSKLMQWASTGIDMFRNVWGRIVTTVDAITDGAKGVWKYAEPLKNAIVSFGKWVGGIGKVFFDIDDLAKDGKAVFGFFADKFKGMWSKVTGIFSAGQGTLLGTVGKFLGRLGWFMTAWDVLTGMWDGFQKDGIMGAIIGGVKGFFKGFAQLGNLIKDLASWALNKLGFENLAKALDSFDLVSLVNNTIDGLYNWFKTLFTDPTEALSQLWQNLVGEGGFMDLLFSPINKLIDWVTKALGFREKDAPEFNLGSVFRSIWNTIIDWVASMVESIPAVGKKGAEMIRGLQAGQATVDVKQMATKVEEAPKAAKQVPAKVANTTGDQLNNAAAEKRNTDVVAEAARDTAIMTGVGNTGGSSGGGGVVNANSSTSNIHIQQGNLPDRTDWSVMSGSFGLAP